MVGADKIIGIDINPDREEWGRKFGMTHFINSKGLSRDETVAKIVEATDGGADYSRSEEHTSELQSLMRISYAVFCLKKKTQHILEEPKHATTPLQYRSRKQRNSGDTAQHET